MHIANENLRRYRENGFDKIEGWCNPAVFYALDLLDSAPINKTGGICEIGVHHGKFFLALSQLSAEPSYAIDLFDQQALNIDKSGKGNRKIFESNLARYDPHQGKNTKIIVGDSTDDGLELAKHIQPRSMRFFSVDGGHAAEHAVRDLQTANQLVSHEGVVIVDDFPNWKLLGVVEGVVAYLWMRPTLVPFAVGANKLYFASLSYRNVYFDLFSKSKLKLKTTEFFGHELVALIANP
jgi:hypothetical protein